MGRLLWCLWRALVVAGVLIQAFAIVLDCNDSKTSAQSMAAIL